MHKFFQKLEIGSKSAEYALSQNYTKIGKKKKTNPRSLNPKI